jgi:nitrite reductase/ring-hydroxylating ferredoxin subunit
LPLWTPVALSRDILPGTSNPSQIGAQDLAVWRSASGKIAAWADRCPHRGMRLSHGFVRGEALSCIYHGWSYGEGGQCQRIPAHPDLVPPEAIRVPRFAVVESDGAIWVAAVEQMPDELPPAFSGFDGFRSLRIEAPADAVIAAVGQGEVTLGGLKAVALVQPLQNGATTLHLLAPKATSAADLNRLSQAAEALRRDVEARQEAMA